jgi:hypothetical protein
VHRRADRAHRNLPDHGRRAPPLAPASRRLFSRRPPAPRPCPGVLRCRAPARGAPAWLQGSHPSSRTRRAAPLHVASLRPRSWAAWRGCHGGCSARPAPRSLHSNDRSHDSVVFASRLDLGMAPAPLAARTRPLAPPLRCNTAHAHTDALGAAPCPHRPAEPLAPRSWVAARRLGARLMAPARLMGSPRGLLLCSALAAVQETDTPPLKSAPGFCQPFGRKSKTASRPCQHLPRTPDGSRGGSRGWQAIGNLQHTCKTKHGRARPRAGAPAVSSRAPRRTPRDGARARRCPPRGHAPSCAWRSAWARA